MEEPKSFNVNRKFYYILKNQENMAVFMGEIQNFEWEIYFIVVIHMSMVRKINQIKKFFSTNVNES